jgi:hypothetical protein
VRTRNSSTRLRFVPLEILFLLVAGVSAFACDTPGCPAGTTLEGSVCKRLPSKDNDVSAAPAAAGRPADRTERGSTLTAIGVPNAGSGGAGAPSKAGAGAGGAPGAGVAGGAAGAQGPAPETCTTEGMTRCSRSGQNRREMCASGHWVAVSACSSTETCASDGACKPLSELCRGSAGQPVCDAQGAMLQCNADGTAGAPQMCTSAAHCQAGLARQSCAVCLPREHRCTGVSLEECASDGMGFVRVKDCATAALCNKVVGDCSTAACQPNKYLCVGNGLAKCNADGTGYATPSPCGTGTCDAEGGDCNICQPGQKGCEQNTVLTCKPDGRGYDSQACANNGQCIGGGMCVACTQDSHCPKSVDPCKVPYCTTDNRCATLQAPDATTCTSGSFGAGLCLAGACVACVADMDCHAGLVCQKATHTCVSKCGDSVFDAEGEECEPPNTATCDAHCKFTTPHAIIRQTFGPCAADAPYASGGVGDHEFCTYKCSSVSDCPEARSNTGCGDVRESACSYHCSMTDTMCPRYSKCDGAKCIPDY